MRLAKLLSDPAAYEVAARVVIKQYGERRTGTNYLRSLLEQTFTTFSF